jgi:gliding motility-associated-like protein
MRQYFTILLLFVGVLAGAQEICNNAVDDDADGLVDLNDPDCDTCQQTVPVPSLIPNPSFEAYSQCPTSFSQLNYADTWVQATFATTDYMNTCGFYSDLDMLPFPDGNAVVGTIFMEGWQEYLGACLLSPLIAGTEYQLQFYIASKPENGQLQIGNNGDIWYGPIAITIFGTSDCTQLPVMTTGCPTDANPNWYEVGAATYKPSNQWSLLTINFTPTADTYAIMIGSPCELPPGYAPIINENGFADPYFLYDNLQLNQASLVQAVAVTASGNFCTGDVVLHANATPESTDYDYQWFLNGVAITGATAETLAVPTYVPGAQYVVVATHEGICLRSSEVEMTAEPPLPPLVDDHVEYCQFEDAVPLQAVGTDLLWYTVPEGGTGNTEAPTPSTDQEGFFSFYVSQSCAGIESPRAPILVKVIPTLVSNFPPFDVVCPGTPLPQLPIIAPNGVFGQWEPSTVDPLQSGTYTFMPTGSRCVLPQTLDIVISPPVEFTIESGCDGPIYLMTAIPESGSFPDDVTFEWSDAMGNAIGSGSPQVNLTAIVNATPETETFPATYSIRVTDANGCTQTQTHTVQRAFCSIPKGVSVNGDGDNDFFNLTGLGVRHLDIYNRYGMVVYSRDNYESEWEGQSDSGKQLPDGTYYYLLTFDDAPAKTGWVYLITKK